MREFKVIATWTSETGADMKGSDEIFVRRTVNCYNTEEIKAILDEWLHDTSSKGWPPIITIETHIK